MLPKSISKCDIVKRKERYGDIQTKKERQRDNKRQNHIKRERDKQAQGKNKKDRLNSETEILNAIRPQEWIPAFVGDPSWEPGHYEIPTLRTSKRRLQIEVVIIRFLDLDPVSLLGRFLIQFRSVGSELLARTLPSSNSLDFKTSTDYEKIVLGLDPVYGG